MLEPSPSKLQEIYKKGYSLEIIYILKAIEAGEDVNEIAKNILKFGGIVQTCIRKNLITDDYKLTLEGKSLMDFLSSSIEGGKLVKKKPKEETFLSWWFTYPGTSTFEYKGKKFVGDRALRVKKSDCEAKINKILNEGEYTIKDLIDALKLEIQQKYESSYKEGKNKMMYFQNSLTYLNQATYIPFIELLKAGHKIEEKPVTTTSNETYI